MFSSNRMSLLVAGLFATFITGPVQAGSPRNDTPEHAGNVTRTEGQVFYHKNGTVRGQALQNPDRNGADVNSQGTPALYIGDSVRSKRASTAWLTLADESRIILKERSAISLHGIKKVSADKGIILFDIRKQGQAQGLKVVTKTAVIGVKGTRFLVDASDDTLSIYLSEGNIAVQSLQGDFKRHRQRQQDEAEDYYEKQRDAYQEYLKGLQQEFVEYVREFDMKANSAIVISNQEVRDIEIPQTVLDEFRLFDRF